MTADPELRACPPARVRPQAAVVMLSEHLHHPAAHPGQCVCAHTVGLCRGASACPPVEAANFCSAACLEHAPHERIGAQHSSDAVQHRWSCDAEGELTPDSGLS